jgi:hypothetical protein
MNITFGEALEALKQGKRITRQGWNGKGMWLFLLPAGSIPAHIVHDPALKEIVEANGGTIVETSSYNIRKDHTNSGLYVILDTQDLGTEIGKIITIEGLRV